MTWDRVVAWFCNACKSWWRIDALLDTAVSDVAAASFLDPACCQGDSVNP